MTDYFLRATETIRDFNADLPAAPTGNQVLAYYLKGLYISGMRKDLKAKVLENAFTNIMQVQDYSLKMEFITNAKTRQGTPPVLSVKEMDRDINAVTVNEEEE